MLAVEMRGLASDHCPLHHMAVRLAEALNAKISHIVIQRTGAGDEVTGMMRLVTTTGLRSTYVDAAAALAIAIHTELPVFSALVRSRQRRPIVPYQFPPCHGSTTPV